VKTRLILKPGQRGTKSLAQEYGDTLLCVRFRYDAKLRQRLKKVELIVERSEWTPPPQRYTADTLVPVRIEVADMPLRLQAKAAGGRWNPEKRLWYVKYSKIAGTALEKHIYVDAKFRLDNNWLGISKMDWQPITESDIWEKIIQAEKRMNAEQMRLWTVIKIDPQKWQQTPYGTKGNGFWAVAVIGESVVWFNDIEDGFNVSSYKKFGVIEEYWCNQDELEWTVQSLLNCIQNGYSLPKCSPPKPGPYEVGWKK